jgi:mRNA interferase HigB
VNDRTVLSDLKFSLLSLGITIAEKVAVKSCCVAVRGTTMPSIAAVRIATGTRRRIVTTTSVFGWFPLASTPALPELLDGNLASVLLGVQIATCDRGNEIQTATEGSGLVGNLPKTHSSHITIFQSAISMRVISKRTLREFWEYPEYEDARVPLEAWYREAKNATWQEPMEIKAQYRSASILKDGRVVFNIAGNKYRLVVWINYPTQNLFIKFIGTHKQYDRIDAETI